MSYEYCYKCEDNVQAIRIKLEKYIYIWKCPECNQKHTMRYGK